LPGNPGNVVVVGHRVDHHRDFRNIHQLVRGDEVIFHTGAGRFRYVVTGTSIVPASAVHVIDQTPASTGTLIACHPPGSTRSRIVVKLAYAP
jgi:sortase A